MLQNLQNAAPASRAFRPERVAPVLSAFEETVCGGVAALVRPLRIRRTTWARFVRRVLVLETDFRDLNAQELAIEIMTLVRELRRKRQDISLISRSFALIRETSFRVLGMRHYESQIRNATFQLMEILRHQQATS